MSNEAKTFEETYTSLKESLSSIGLSPCRNNKAKFFIQKNELVIYVATKIPTNKVICNIGDNEYKDNIYQYQVWIEKNGVTLSSVSGGGEGNLDEDAIVAAVEGFKSMF